jgi:hypothetical protein
MRLFFTQVTHCLWGIIFDFLYVISQSGSTLTANIFGFLWVSLGFEHVCVFGGKGHKGRQAQRWLAPWELPSLRKVSDSIGCLSQGGMRCPPPFPIGKYFFEQYFSQEINE